MGDSIDRLISLGVIEDGQDFFRVVPFSDGRGLKRARIERWLRDEKEWEQDAWDLDFSRVEKASRERINFVGLTADVLATYGLAPDGSPVGSIEKRENFSTRNPAQQLLPLTEPVDCSGRLSMRRALSIGMRHSPTSRSHVRKPLTASASQNPAATEWRLHKRLISFFKQLFTKQD